VPAVKAGLVMSKVLPTAPDRSSVRPLSTANEPVVGPGSNCPSTASVLPDPESVPVPKRSAVAGSVYVDPVRSARSNRAVPVSDSPPVPMAPEPLRRSTPASTDVSPV